MSEKPTNEELDKTDMGRKLNEDKLRESEKRYRSIIHKIQAAVVVHDADTRIITSNSKAQELLGLTEDQMLEKTAIDPDWKFLNADGERMSLTEYPVNQVLATRQPLRDLTCGINRPDKGDQVWVLVSADPVFDKKGNIQQVIVTFMDFTERKRAEEALRASENRYRPVSGLTSDHAYSYRISPDGELINEWVTGALTRTTGYTREELSSLGGWERLIHPDDMTIPQSQLEALLSNQAKTVEYRIVTKDGRIRWVLDYARPTWNVAESRVTRIEGAIQDVTKRKQAEKAVLESEERFRLLSEASFEGIAITDKGIILDANVQFARIFGYDHNEVIGMEVQRLVAPEFRDLVLQKVKTGFQEPYDSDFAL